MTNYEGDIANPKPSPMDKELTFNPDEIFDLASVKTTDYDTAVDSAITSSFEAEPQDTSCYNTDAGFASCLNVQVEQTKFGASIGSTTTSDDCCCLFLGQNNVNLTSKDLEKFLSNLLDENWIDSVIKAVKAS